MFAMEINCVVCGGSDEDCPHCRGTARVEVRRCPWAILHSSDITAVELCVLFIEKGLLPFPGTLVEQPRVFYDAWRIVAGVSAEAQDREMERARASNSNR